MLPDLDLLNKLCDNTLARTLGIKFSKVEEYPFQNKKGIKLVGTMPVDNKTQQGFNFLHGGASVALAETLGSVASFILISLDNSANKTCFGLEVNANHLRPVEVGHIVTGVCTPLHLGKVTHVWDIKIENEESQLVCVSRLTVKIVDQ